MKCHPYKSSQSWPLITLRPNAKFNGIPSMVKKQQKYEKKYKLKIKKKKLKKQSKTNETNHQIHHAAILKSSLKIIYVIPFIEITSN